jgi:5-methylcytosine-specific restriction endonuclease McrA
MRRPSYTDEQLRDAVAASTSYRQVLPKLGLKIAGGTYNTMMKHVARLQLDVSHMKGQGWANGDTIKSNPRIRSKRQLEDIFCEGSLARNSCVRNIIVVEQLIPYKCSECNLSEWKGKKLSLEMHHRNHNSSDNRIENLTFLCPNCHSITPSYRKKNYKKGLTKLSDEDILLAHEGSKNIKQMCEKLRIRADGDNYGVVRRRLRMLGVMM